MRHNLNNILRVNIKKKIASEKSSEKCLFGIQRPEPEYEGQI